MYSNSGWTLRLGSSFDVPDSSMVRVSKTSECRSNSYARSWHISLAHRAMQGSAFTFTYDFSSCPVAHIPLLAKSLSISGDFTKFDDPLFGCDGEIEVRVTAVTMWRGPINTDHQALSLHVRPPRAAGDLLLLFRSLRQVALPLSTRHACCNLARKPTQLVLSKRHVQSGDFFTTYIMWRYVTRSRSTQRQPRHSRLPWQLVKKSTCVQTFVSSALVARELLASIVASSV